MHSVVVFGDVRSHIIQLPPGDLKIGWPGSAWAGGAVLMKSAVERALGGNVKVFGMKDPFSEGEGAKFLGCQLRNWSLREAPAGRVDDPSKPPSTRLFLESASHSGQLFHQEETAFAHIDPSLRDALRFFAPEWAKKPGFPATSTDAVSKESGLNFGQFCPPGESFPWCPDIVVFDDLAASLRDVPLGIADQSLAESAKLKGKNQKTGALRKDLFEDALRNVVARLLIAGKLLAINPGQPSLEPVVICSVIGGLPTVATAKAVPKRTFWEHLYADRELRNRTIVLLDAEELRRHDRLAISSGLSWERTAQDTLYELRSTKRGRAVLRFSQVIVRFGATGALHIARRGNASTARLFFDPQRDDRGLTDPEKDGTVLGGSAAFAACVARGLYDRCRARDSKPILHDIADAVDGAMPAALRVCQGLVVNGYGKLASLRKAGQVECEFKESQFADSDRLSVSMANVPEHRSASWSILHQSTQGRLWDAAKRVVLRGIDATLNQPAATPADVQRRVLNGWRDELRRTTATATGRARKALEAFLLKTARTRGGRHWVDAVMSPEARRAARRGMSAIALLPAWEPAIDEVELCLANRGGRRAAEEILGKLAQDIGFRHDCIDVDYLGKIAGRSFSAPVERIGKRLCLIDRGEIEGIRAIRKLIEGHLEDIANKKAKRPLSIAVFGPPGSGKSFAVKALLDVLEKKYEKDPGIDKITQLPAFNIAQYGAVGNLDEPFKRIVDATAAKQLPVAFFDEFDARLDTTPCGWLKFFLSPMEDATYQSSPVGNAILVFAGGTSKTYEEFSQANRQSTDEQVREFGLAKGPDFTSRLAGHLNIVGVDPATPTDESYLIRRAVIVRDILDGIQGLEGTRGARIDHELLHAILYVPRYVNGARSIRTLLNMCAHGERRRVSTSSLPLIEQLNTLTDGKAFMDLMERYRHLVRPLSRRK